MYTRKLVKAGASSHTIALPKAWLKRNGLTRGDSILLVERSSTELVVTPTLEPTTSPGTEITIGVDGKTEGTLQREITAAYLNNYSSIVLTGKALPKLAKRLRNILHDFVAVEITEQTGRSIVAKDLLNLEEIAVDKTIKRMDMMLRSLLSDAASANFTVENALLRDQDINRLFFLLYRLLKRSVDDHAMQRRLGLTGAQLLSTWAIIHHIENLADRAVRLPELLSALRKDAQQQGKALIKSVEQQYLDTMKAYYTNDRALADKTASEWSSVVAEQKTMITKHPDVPTVEFITQLTSMASLSADIARVVIDDAAPEDPESTPSGM